MKTEVYAETDLESQNARNGQVLDGQGYPGTAADTDQAEVPAALGPAWRRTRKRPRGRTRKEARSPERVVSRGQAKKVPKRERKVPRGEKRTEACLPDVATQTSLVPLAGEDALEQGDTACKA